MEKKTVVLYPGVGVGHLAPMLELAKAFLRHGGDQQVDVAIVVFEPPVYANGFAATVARAKVSNISVALHVLPPPPASESGDDAEPADPLARLLRFLRATNAPLRDFLASWRVQAVVLDMFCADALDVAAELGLPAYFFFPSGAAGLACFLGLPAMRASVGTSFGELGESAVLSFPGVPPFTVANLPEGLLDDGEACRGIIRMAARMPDARGILVNSFESLEPRAMRALRDGLCVPDRPTPPVYCVGPLVSPGCDKDDGHDCLRWLDVSRTAASCSSASGAWARSPRSSWRRSPSVWRGPGRGSSGSCGALPANHPPTTTSARCPRPGSRSAPGTGGSSSRTGRRRCTCCGTARPARS